MVDFQSRDTRRGRSATGADAGDASADPPDDGATGEADDEDVAGDRSGPDAGGVAAAVVTVSATRSHDDDPGGDAVVEALEGAGHAVATREVLRPSHDAVQQSLDTLTARDDVDVVVVSGGVGVGPDEVTIAAVEPLFDTGLPGFGELFRRRYADRVGADVVADRTTAGLTDDTPVFCLPADPVGARLGTAEIVVDQAPGLVERVTTGDGADDDG